MHRDKNGDLVPDDKLCFVVEWKWEVWDANCLTISTSRTLENAKKSLASVRKSYAVEE